MISVSKVWQGPRAAAAMMVLASAMMTAAPVSLVQAQDLVSQDLVSEDEAFEAVFNDPGNVLLNFALVAAQIRNGNFKEAAGTLERILILLPEEPRAQMLLATVQFNLGNGPEAERLARKVEANPAASIVQKNEAQALIAQIEDGRKLFDFAGVVAIGGGIADNPAGGSIGNLAQPMVGGSFGENVSSRATNEEFTSAAVNISLSRNLEAQRPRQVTVSASLYSRDYATYQAGDMKTLSTAVSYNQNTAQGRYNASLSASMVNVKDQPYQNNYQATLGYTHIFDSGVTAAISAGASRKVFKTFDSTTNTLKTGNTHTVSGSVGKLIGETRFLLDMAVSDVNAVVATNAKTTRSVGVSATSLLLPGVSTVRLGASQDSFRGLDTTYTTTPFYKRKDSSTSLRVTYLLGLTSFGQPNGSEPYLNVTGTYAKTKSNIVNFSKYSGEVGLTINQPL